MPEIDTCAENRSDGTRCPCRRYITPPTYHGAVSESPDCFSCHHIEGAHPLSQPEKAKKTTSDVLSKYGIEVKTSGPVGNKSSSKSKEVTKKNSQELTVLVSEDEARAEVNNTLSEKKAGGSKKDKKKKAKDVVVPKAELIKVERVGIIMENVTQPDFEVKIPDANEFATMTNCRVGIIHKDSNEASRLAFQKTWSSEAIDTHLKSMMNPQVFEWGKKHHPEAFGKYGWHLLVKKGGRLVPYVKTANDLSGCDLSQCIGPKGRAWNDHYMWFALTFDIPREVWLEKNWDLSPADLSTDDSSSEAHDEDEQSKLDAKLTKTPASKGKKRSLAPDSDSISNDGKTTESGGTHNMSTRAQTRSSKLNVAAINKNTVSHGAESEQVLTADQGNDGSLVTSHSESNLFIPSDRSCTPPAATENALTLATIVGEQQAALVPGASTNRMDLDQALPVNAIAANPSAGPAGSTSDYAHSYINRHYRKRCRSGFASPEKTDCNPWEEASKRARYN